jgi:hypothetical protein
MRPDEQVENQRVNGSAIINTTSIQAFHGRLQKEREAAPERATSLAPVEAIPLTAKGRRRDPSVGR